LFDKTPTLALTQGHSQFRTFLPLSISLSFPRLEVTPQIQLTDFGRDQPKFEFGFGYGAENGDIFSFGYGRNREARFRPTFGYGRDYDKVSA